MKKITLLMSVIALVFSTSVSAQLFSENFEDQNAGNRMVVIKDASSLNAYSLAEAYSGLSVDALANGGDYCFKVQVNTDGSSSAFVGIVPKISELSGEYTITFDAWMNFSPEDGSATEYLRYGVGHTQQFPFKTDSYRLADGYDFAFDAENGSTYDLQLYGAGSDLDYSADADWIYADQDNAEQNGNIDEIQTLYQKSYDDTGDINVKPGNRWLKVQLVATGTSVIYYVNGVEWARIEKADTKGFPIIGYMDKYDSQSMDDSFLLVDNIVIEAGNTLANENNVLTNVSIYPNPAKGMVNVSVEGKANFQLFNISGQSVMNMDIKGTTSVDISSLNSGMYFSRITSETGATKTLKLQVK